MHREMEPVTTQKILGVSTKCPFCSGRALLRDEVTANQTAAEITVEFAGKQLTCAHPNCGKTFRVRRADVIIEWQRSRR